MNHLANTNAGSAAFGICSARLPASRRGAVRELSTRFNTNPVPVNDGSLWYLDNRPFGREARRGFLPTEGSQTAILAGGTLCAYRSSRMSAPRVLATVQAIDKWRRRPVYRARIVNSEVGGIVVKSARKFSVGKRISFAKLVDLDGTDTDRTPVDHRWRSAVIWRIEKGCLHLTRT